MVGLSRGPPIWVEFQERNRREVSSLFFSEVLLVGTVIVVLLLQSHSCKDLK